MSKKLDHLGITASLACAVHCAALPFIITMLPLWGLGFLADSWVEMTMIGLSLVVGIWSLGSSYPRHRKALPVAILLTGFALIAAGHYLLHEFEAALIPLGGVVIAAAHLVNWRYTRLCKHL